MSDTVSSIPVTIIAGFLGAGKTTLLQHILTSDHGHRILVIQNEFSDEMGIESPLLVDKNGDIIPDMFELPNGCMCCSVRDSLVGTLETILTSRPSEFDYVIVETSGVTDPEKIITIFWTDTDLGSLIYLDGVVTIIDATSIQRYLSLTHNQANELLNKNEISDHINDYIRINLTNLLVMGHKTSNDQTIMTLTSKETPSDSIYTPLAYIAAKQISCGNILLMNKCDSLQTNSTESNSESDLNQIEDQLKAINPGAQILRSNYGIVPLNKLLHIQAFSMSLSNIMFKESTNSLTHQHTLLPHLNHISHCSISLTIDLHYASSEILTHLSLEDTHLVEKNQPFPNILTMESFMESSLWTESEVNSLIGEIIWDSKLGQIYRCKGLFVCRPMKTSNTIELYELQGVGDMFEINHIPNTLKTSCLSKMRSIGSIELLDQHQLRVTCKFLFVGHHLQKEELRLKLIQKNGWVLMYLSFTLGDPIKHILSDSKNHTQESYTTDEVETQMPPVDISSSDPERFVIQGKQFIKQGDYDEALDCFSTAVQLKLEKLEGDECETHPDLGLFYLEYGHALLQKAENSNHLFKNDKAEDSLNNSSINVVSKETNLDDHSGSIESCDMSNDLNSEFKDDDPVVSDEQLSWEILELARMCYIKSLQQLETDGIIPYPSESAFKKMNFSNEQHVKIVENASFIHLRLGDLLLIEEQFDSAAEEFSKALDIVKKYNLFYTSRISASVALAQAQLFGNHAHDALTTFQDALLLMSNQLEGVGGAIVPENRLQDYEANKEDLLIQIAELDRNIRDGVYNAKTLSHSELSSVPSDSTLVHSPTFLERTGAKQQISSTVSMNPFDTPQLTSTDDPVVHLGVIRGKRHTEFLTSNDNSLEIGTQSNQPKRYRIQVPSHSNEEVSQNDTVAKSITH